MQRPSPSLGLGAAEGWLGCCVCCLAGSGAAEAPYRCRGHARSPRSLGHWSTAGRFPHHLRCEPAQTRCAVDGALAKVLFFVQSVDSRKN
jgi:hypothetical protein